MDDFLKALRKTTSNVVVNRNNRQYAVYITLNLVLKGEKIMANKRKESWLLKDPCFVPKSKKIRIAMFIIINLLLI